MGASVTRRQQVYWQLRENMADPYDWPDDDAVIDTALEWAADLVKELRDALPAGTPAWTVLDGAVSTILGEDLCGECGRKIDRTSYSTRMGGPGVFCSGVCTTRHTEKMLNGA